MDSIIAFIDSLKGLSKKIWLLAILMFINRSGYMVVPFLSIYITVEMGYTLEQAGFILMIFGLGSLIGTFLGGFLTDKIGHWIVQLCSLILTAILFIVLEQMGSFWSLTSLVFLLGIAADAFRPANMTAVGTYSSPENKTLAVSVMRFAIHMGWSIGPFLGGIIADSFGFSWLFWIDGATCVLAALFLIAFIEKETSSAKDKTKEVTKSTKAVSVIGDKRFLVFVLLNAILMIAFLQMFTTLPVYFESQLHLSNKVIGRLLMINGLIIAIAELPVVHALQSRSALRIIFVGTLLIGAALLLLNSSTWMFIIVMAIILWTLGEILHIPFANAYTMTAAPKGHMGRYLSLYNMSFSVAFIVAPLLGMKIADQWNYSILWYFMFGISIFAAVGYYLLTHWYPEKESNDEE